MAASLTRNVRAAEQRAAEAKQAFEVPVLLAALAVIPVLVIEERFVGAGWEALAFAANWAIWGVFAVEFLTVVSITPHKARYTRSAWLDVIVIVASAPVLPHVLAAARLLRLSRLAYVLRLLRFPTLAAVIGGAGAAVRSIFSSHGLTQLAALTAFLALGAGGLFALVEPGARHIGDGLWWAVVTISTVGYGDITPTTTIGRLAGGALMLFGIAFLAAVTAAVAARFVVEDEEEVIEETHEIRQRIDEIQNQLDRIEAALEVRQGAG